MLFQQKNEDLQTVYGRDNTNQARMPYFHCRPFKKKAKQEKKEKEKKGQWVAKISLDRIQKEKYPKKGINDDSNNDIISK